VAKEKEPGRATPPPQFAETPPFSYPSGDYSYTVELVATIQHTLGRLTEAVESLKAQSKEHSDEIKAIGKDVYAAKAVGRTLLWVVGVVGTLLGIVLAAYFRQLFSGSAR
jgi:hypothetical protein